MNKPNEKPIIFSTPMIQAILDGRKSQTRRIVKQPKKWSQYTYCDPFAMPPAVWWWDGKYEKVGVRQECPYGVVGDRLWVRETFSILQNKETMNRPIYKATTVYGKSFCKEKIHGDKCAIRWKSPRFMPRWASRILLEITGVRVERLQDITEEDAKKEGLPCTITVMNGSRKFFDKQTNDFQELWNSIYGPDAWDENPWVWVLDFKLVE